MINKLLDFLKYNMPSKRTIILGIFAIYLLILLILFLTHLSNDNNDSGNKKVAVKETSASGNDILEEIKNKAKSKKVDISSNTEKKKKSVKSQIDFDAEYPFLIRINRAENFATVYGINKKGKYKLAYKTFRCSTGLNTENTPLGTFHSYEKFRWHQMVDGTYSQYCVRIFGAIMLHSIPYEKPKSDTLEYLSTKHSATF